MSFLKRFILSKEPIVLKLESCDNMASIYLKNKRDDGLFTMNSDNKKFTITNNDKQLFEVYYDIIKQYSVLNTDLIHAKKIVSSQLIFQEYNHPTDGLTFKGIINHLSGIHHILPSQLHSHRFLARTIGSSYNEWMRIQGKKNGEAQVGIGTTVMCADASLHVNGKIYCDSIVTKDAHLRSSEIITREAQYTYLLDENKKIHPQYLPETYKASLIQNDVGVGIGTKLPLQKLHVEGGCYIRDRVGIGNTQPKSIIDIVQTSSDITSLHIQQTDGNVFEAWNKDTPLFVLSSSGCVGIGTKYEEDKACTIKGGILTDQATTKQLDVVDNGGSMFRVDSSHIQASVPVVFDKEIECETIYSKDKLQLNTKSVSMTNVYANETYIRIPSEDEFQTIEPLDISTLISELLPRLRPYLLDGKKISIIQKKNDIDNEELQELFSNLHEDGNYLRKDDILYILVATINDLHQRVKQLELQKY